MRTRSAAVVVVLASLLAVTSGCTDDSLPSAPRRVGPPGATLYAATVSGPSVLGSLPGSTQDIPSAINAAGDVTGVSAGQAVLWSTGAGVSPTSTAPNLPPLGLGRGLSINAAGQIAGETVPPFQAALWTPNGSGGYTYTDINAQLPSPIISTASAVNAGGKVVGSFRVQVGTAFVDRCFLWTPTSPNATTGTVSIPANDLGAGTFCVANDINSAGTIAGASNASTFLTHAFVWDGNSGSPLTDLTPGSPLMSYARAINDGGQVAGSRLTSATIGGVINGAIWTPTSGGPPSYTVEDLGTFGHDESAIEDINDAGFVVGYARNNAILIDDAFFWQNGVFTPLLGVAGYLTDPTGLNNLTNSGVVLVVGASTNNVTGQRVGLRWAVTLTQVTPQGCIADLVALINQMQAAGALRAGEAKSLLAKLDATSRQIAQGHTTPARNLLYAFINEVNALVASGRLTAAQAQPLIDGAECAINAL